VEREITSRAPISGGWITVGQGASAALVAVSPVASAVRQRVLPPGARKGISGERWQDVGWLVVEHVPASVAFASARRLARHSWWAGAAIFLLVLLLAWRVSRSISQPLLRLTEGAAIIGSGDLSHRVGTGAPDEVGELSRAVDAMTGNLQRVTASRDSLDREVAARAQAEEALRVTLMSIGDAVIATDTEGRITLMNPTAVCMTGWSVEEAVDRPLDEVFIIRNEHTDEPIQSPLVEVLKQGRIVGLANHTKLIRRDGSELPISDSGAPITSADGEILGAVLVFQDDTRRRRAEREQAQLALYRLASELTSDYIFTVAVDPAGEMVVDWMSEGFTTLTGLTLDDVRLPSLWPDVIDSVDMPAFDDFFAELVAGRAASVEIRLQAADGQILWLSIKGKPQRIADEQVSKLLVGAQDISARKLAEASIREHVIEVEAVNAELESFAYSVSHDLRTPLRAVEGFSNALLEDCAEQLDDRGKDYLARVSGEALRMSGLIDDLLALSRVTRADMKSADVDLGRMARDIIAGLRQTDLARQVEVAIGGDLVVQGDVRLLRQLLDNLLGNAWKFTARCEVAKIGFNTTEHDGQRAFVVRDNGAGFDMAYVDKLFTPFQRLHGTSEFPGNGIGLSTVHRIVKRHGGRVWCDGAVGKGASFYFTLQPLPGGIT